LVIAVGSCGLFRFIVFCTTNIAGLMRVSREWSRRVAAPVGRPHIVGDVGVDVHLG
jgi:hypothetical protein